jgi:hypothetical protein
MFQRYVVSVSMDVAKVDRDVLYVAMVVHVCCKSLFQMFHLFFKRMLQVCLSRCCICFTHMLQVFYLDVAYVFQWLFKCFHVFLQVFQTQASNVSFIFRRLFVNVSFRCFKNRSGVAARTYLPQQATGREK